MSTPASLTAPEIASGWRKWDAWYRCELPRALGGYLLVTRLHHDTVEGAHRWCWSWRSPDGRLLASGPSDPVRRPITDPDVAMERAVAKVCEELGDKVRPVKAIGPQDERLTRGAA